MAKSSVRGLTSLLSFFCKWMTCKGAVHSEDKQMRSLVSILGISSQPWNFKFNFFSFQNNIGHILKSQKVPQGLHWKMTICPTPPWLRTEANTWMSFAHLFFFFVCVFLNHRLRLRCLEFSTLLTSYWGGWEGDSVLLFPTSTPTSMQWILLGTSIPRLLLFSVYVVTTTPRCLLALPLVLCVECLGFYLQGVWQDLFLAPCGFRWSHVTAVFPWK